MNQIQAKKIDQIIQIVEEMQLSLPQDIEERTRIPEDEIEDLISIIDKIRFHDAPIATVLYSNGNFSWIQKTYNTGQFLQVGGCLNYYHNLIEDQKKRNSIKELEEQRLRNEIASFKITKNQYRWNKWIAITGFIIALFSLLLQLFYKSS